MHRLAQGQQQPVHCFSCGGRQSGDLTEEEEQAKVREQADGGDVSDPSIYLEIEEDKGQVSTFPLEENSANQAKSRKMKLTPLTPTENNNNLRTD